MSIDEQLSRFFAHDDYFIDENVAFLKFTNSYKVYDSDGSQIGTIEQLMPAWHKFLSLIVSKSFFPLRLDIKDLDGNVLVTIKRGWTFLMSKMEILDAGGEPIAFIAQKFRFLKPTFTILEPGGEQAAVITGDWKAWNFTISDAEHNTIGTISKKWNGALKEFFTTADKYVVSIDPDGEIARKIPILATAITIDMVLKESN